MPLYEFKCTKCGASKELIKSVEKLEEIIECSCGYLMQRVISTSNFNLKGTGWAKDGYK